MAKKLPLEGIRILEAGAALAVPLACRILGDYGAEVIKLESAARPEIGRVTIFANNEPGGRYWEKGGFYNEANRNKKDVSVDLSQPDGRRVFLELVKVCDVVLENFTPRVMENFGLTYENLKAVNPDVIMLSSTGFGHDGPWRDYRAYGYSLEPTSGVTHSTGYSDLPPMRSMISYTDTPAAYVGAFAVLAALEYRSQTGEGQWIDLSQYEVGATFVGEATIERQITGRQSNRMGNRDKAMAPHGAYRCLGDDAWLAVAIRDDADWLALCKALDRPDLLDDSRFTSLAGRKQHEDLIDEVLSAWSVTREANAAAVTLQAAGVPAGLVEDSRELHYDEHLIARDFFSKVTHAADIPDLGTRIYAGAPWRLKDGRPPIRVPAPTLGQHNDDILRGLIGLDNTEMDSLSELGVIDTVPHGIRRRNRDHSNTLDELRDLGVIRDYDLDYRKRLGIED